MQINALAVLSSNSPAQGDDSHLSKTYYIWRSQEFYQGLKREDVSQNISHSVTERKCIGRKWISDTKRKASLFLQTTITAFIKKCISIETNYCPLNYILGLILLLIPFLHSQNLTFVSYGFFVYFLEISRQILFRNDLKQITIAGRSVLGSSDPVPGNTSAYAYIHLC